MKNKNFIKNFPRCALIETGSSVLLCNFLIAEWSFQGQICQELWIRLLPLQDENEAHCFTKFKRFLCSSFVVFQNLLMAKLWSSCISYITFYRSEILLKVLFEIPRPGF